MRILWVVFVLVLGTASYAQEEGMVRIAGKITDSIGKGLEDVQIKNITQRRFTVTNAKGEFYTGVKPGDTLQYSHIGFELLTTVITNENIRSHQLLLIMLPSTEQLAEVVVAKEKIDEVSVGIVPSKMRVFTKKERELRTASRLGSFEEIFMHGAIFLPLDPLINLISGRTKKIKQELKLDASQRNVKALNEKFFTYLTMSVKVPEDNVMEFMYYLVDTGKDERLLTMENSLAEMYITDAYIEYSKRN